PGRKTDVKDAQWIADLLRHGLLRGSHIPERPQRELRELVRYRRSLVRQRAQVVHRIRQAWKAPTSAQQWGHQRGGGIWACHAGSPG
ncbi:MAG TPA: transposase, partial [Dehalococcoidia bacterium]|nr:transposase [Dehalococcoidia bacterium]